MISHSEAIQRVKARLDTPRAEGEQWSTDHYTRGRHDLLNYLARHGRSGDFGDYFELLADPLALHVPGSYERTVHALVNAVANTGMPVTADSQAGSRPRFALGGRHTTAGLMDVRGVALVLLVEYQHKGMETPAELLYAATRLSISGTHANAVTYGFMQALKREVGQ